MVDQFKEVHKIVKKTKLSISNKLLQDEIDGIKFREKDLDRICEEFENEDPIIIAFEKQQLEKNKVIYKKVRELYEEALKLSPNKRGDLIREAMLLEYSAEEGVNSIFYDKDSEEELKEEFKNFKKEL